MPIEGITSFFFNQGVLGVIIIVLGIVIVMQDRRGRSDIKDRDNVVAALRAEVATLQDKRVGDSNTYSNSFITVSQQLLNQNKELVSLAETNQRSIERIAEILQAMK